MSPEMKAALRAIESCQKQIEKLKHRAIQGDAAAALVLVDLGVFATRAVQDLWFTPSIYNPFDGHSGKDGLIAQHEILSFWLKARDALPTLDPEDSRQKEMLRGIRSGPFKTRKRKQTDMKTLLESMILPQFENILHKPDRPTGIEGQIWDLPPLSPASLKFWADMIVAWLWEKHKAKMTDKDSWLYKLTRAERGYSIDKERRKETLKERIKKRKKRGGGEMGFVDETWTGHEEDKIDKMSVTHAHIKNGLKAEIIEYWQRHLTPLHASKKTPSRK